MLGLHGLPKRDLLEAQVKLRGYLSLISMYYGFLYDKHYTITTSFSNVLVNNLLASLHYIDITDLCMTVPHFDTFQCCSPPL